MIFIVLVAGSHEFYRDFLRHNSKFNFFFSPSMYRGFRIWTRHCNGNLEIRERIEAIKFMVFNLSALSFSFFMDSRLVWSWLYDALYYKKFTLLGTFLARVFY
jgi:hypothetical protein